MCVLDGNQWVSEHTWADSSRIWDKLKDQGGEAGGQSGVSGDSAAALAVVTSVCSCRKRP